jgi:hypothetical protein
MATAMYVARIIHNDMTLTNAKSWQWWTAITEVDFKDGLVYLDDGSKGDSGNMGAHVASLQHDGEVRDSKLLWTLGNYSRFIRPGMVRIKCELSEEQSNEDGLLVSAYRDKQSDKQVFVFTNLSDKPKMVDMGRSAKVDVFITSKDRNLEIENQNAKSIIIPERSIATVSL